MKKIISLKMFSLLIITIGSMILSACRQDDENDFQETETKVIDHKVNNNTQSKVIDLQNIIEIDPPIKNGTHWKTQK